MQGGRVQRFVLLGTLYFAQGLPFGFFVQAVPVLMRKAGYSLSTIGLATLLSLPWALKFLWAPVVDRSYSRRLGRRRTWILAMQASGTLILGAIALAPGSEALGVLMAGMFALNLVAATQDIATDGLAVELLPPQDRGVANGLQVAGYRIGMITGGGVLLGVHDDLGHHGVFALMALFTALSSVPVLALREPPTVAKREGAPVRETVTHFLRQPGAWRVIALVFSYKLGEAAAQGMFKPFLVDHGLDLDDIAMVIGTVGAVAGMAGALAGGFFVSRLGRLRALVVFGIGQVITVLGYAYLALSTPSYTELYVWSAVEHFASGCATVSLFTSMMDWSRPEASGTDYTVQASAVVIATGVSGLLGGASAQLLGYGGHFVLAAGISAITLLVVVRLFPRSTFPPPAQKQV